MRTRSMFTPILPLCVAVFAIATGLTSSQGAQPVESEDGSDVVGYSFGRAIQWRDIFNPNSKPGVSGFSPPSMVGVAFVDPARKRYVAEHQSELQPTESEVAVFLAEITAAKRARLAGRREGIERGLREIEEQLQSPSLTEDERRELTMKRAGALFELRDPSEIQAVLMLRSILFQRHIYQRYGGRVVAGSGMLISYEAMRSWLNDREEAEAFVIVDPAVRKLIDDRYCKEPEDAIIVEDQETIDQLLVNPGWMSAERRNDGVGDGVNGSVVPAAPPG